MQTFPLPGLLTAAAAVALFFASCQSGNTGEQADTSAVTGNSDSASSAIQKIIYSIPSPMIMADLIKESGSSFDGSLLNSTDNTKKYALETKKAINLGIYGADVSYASMFDERQTSIQYMAAAQKLSRELGVDGILEDDLLTRLKDNEDNRDSLLNIVSEVYADLNDYLKDNNRQAISALVVAGGWVEGLYLALQHTTKNPSPALKTRIAEQKIALNDLISLFEQYGDNPALAETLGDLRSMKGLFEAATEVKGNPQTSREADGTLVIGGGSTYTLADEDMNKINQKIIEIRTRYIS